VAHPLNILALLDMAGQVDQQQRTLGEYRTALLRMLRQALAEKEPGA